MNEPSFPNHLLETLPKEGSSLWPLSTFTLRRNIARSLFPHKQDAKQALLIHNVIKKSVENLPFFKEALYVDFSFLTPYEKEALLHRFYLPIQTIEDRPHQALIIDASCHFVIGIHLEDHLILHKINGEASWHDTLEELIEVEKALSKESEFAFSKKWGYLTSHLMHCGTALEIRAYLHLAAMNESREERVSHMLNSNEEVILKNNLFRKGGVLIAQNRYSLGLSEKQLMQNLHNQVNKLLITERDLRSQMKRSPCEEMKDLVSRSFGILLHSYRLAEEEGYLALCFLKLGIELGWIEGVTEEEVSLLLMKTKNSYLMSQEKKELQEEDLLHKRACLIHEALHKASLKI